MRQDRALRAIAAVLVFTAIPVAAVADTFSIAAVDLATQQVGSAGASCISGCRILSDVHPGRGVVHTQAYWNSQNQAYARSLMNAGYAPAAIIDSVVAHDAQGNPTIRQYGIVDLVDGGRSAAYTGQNCTDWKGHRTGLVWSVQGNILLGPEIVEDMETAFLTTVGSLADKLMAALQAAKVPGADTRCMQYGKSSISAFLRVALPTDPPSGPYYVDLNVNNTPNNVDPIDQLQGLYDTWRQQHTGAEDSDGEGGRLSCFPNPVGGEAIVRFSLARGGEFRLSVIDVAGRLVESLAQGSGTGVGSHELRWAPRDAGPGVYFLRLETPDGARCERILLVR